MLCVFDVDNYQSTVHSQAHLVWSTASWSYQETRRWQTGSRDQSWDVSQTSGQGLAKEMNKNAIIFISRYASSTNLVKLWRFIFSHAVWNWTDCQMSARYTISECMIWECSAISGPIFYIVAECDLIQWEETLRFIFLTETYHSKRWHTDPGAQKLDFMVNLLSLPGSHSPHSSAWWVFGSPFIATGHGQTNQPFDQIHEFKNKICLL